MSCRCNSASHDATCAITELRRALFAGLFDDGRAEPASETRRVRLLDSGYRGDDPASRRFALIEVD